MKRSGPPRRQTPLKQSKDGLRRGVPTSARRTAIPPRRSKPRRRDRDDLDHGIAWADVRVVIYVRSGGRCEGCGTQLNIVSMEGHHRRTRAVGPDCPCNALALCHECHHGDTHGRPALARALGRIIRREDKTPPSQVVVEIHGRGEVRLDCDGNYVLT